MFNIKTAIAGGGLTLAIVAGILGGAAGDISDGSLDGPGNILVSEESFCPPGWEYFDKGDDHIVDMRCVAGEITMKLNADGTPNHWFTSTDLTPRDPSTAPGW